MNKKILSKNIICHHQPIHVPGREPTCAVPGFTEGVYCPLCGETLNRILVIPSTVHRAVEWQIEKAPAPDVCGLMVKKCLDCGEILEENKIPALPALPVDLKPSEGLIYRIKYSTESCEITGQGTCKDKDIVIPDVIDGYRVTSIDTDAADNYGHLFSGFDTDITSVIISNSVKSIGQKAFHGCINLANVILGNSVTSIEDHAFSDCPLLTNIMIPNSVIKIGIGAFSGCTNLTNVIIPNTVKSIGDWAFSHCKNLTSVMIPRSVRSIGEGLFYDCSGISSVAIPDSVSSIGNWAFSDCSRLTSILISDSVMFIEKETFLGCTSLTDICYTGTMEQWKKFKLDKILKKQTAVQKVKCFDGELWISH